MPYPPYPIAPTGGNSSVTFATGIRDMALHNNASWHIISVMLTSMVFCCMPIGFFLALPWLGLTAWQVARTPSWETGRSRALAFCAAYGAAALLIAAIMFINFVTKSDNTTTN